MMKKYLITILILLLVVTLSISCKRKELDKDKEIDPNTVLEEKDPLEILNKAKEIFDSLDYFAISAKGLTVSSGLVVVNQYIHTLTIYDSTNEYNYYKETLSKSSLKKTGERRLVSLNNAKIDEVKSIDLGDNGIKDFTWKNNPYEVTIDEFKETYGIIKPSYVEYIINSDTIIDSIVSIEKNDNNHYDNNHYVIVLNLTPIDSTEIYRKEVAHMAGTDRIDFSSVKVTITIDSNYRILELIANESYTMQVPILGKFDLSTRVVNTFSYKDDSKYNITDYYF